MKKTLFLLLALNCVWSAAASAALETDYTLGDVMYVGDSITHGHTGPASYRWAMHKILVDNGISYDEVGCNTGNNGGGVSPGTVYGGVAFENEHSAQSSARAWEIAGRKDGPRFSHSNIYNWLGLSDTRNDGATYTGKTFTGENTPETFFLMIGTNDTLSDFSGAGIGGNNGENLSKALTNLLSYDSSTQKFSQSGDMDTILKAMRQANSSADITVSSLPCWMDGRGNNNNAQDFAAIVEYNKVLKQWCNENDVRFVEVNRGMYNVANTAKPGIGVADMFISDKLHPSDQGDLIIAGNIAREMGLAGRTAGQERVSATEFEQIVTAAETSATTLVNVSTSEDVLDFSGAGASSVAVTWENVGSENGGFTVELGDWIIGNGDSDGAWDTTNNFTIKLGNESLYGTLSINEAYIQWGNDILFSENMSTLGSEESLRIAYLAGSASEGVKQGFYVWLGDMLIGEALGATSGEGNNGVTLSYAGSGSVTLGSLSLNASASYAPATTLTTNSADAFLAKVVKPRPAATPQGIPTLPTSYDITKTVASSAFGGDAVAAAGLNDNIKNTDKVSITVDIGTATSNAFGNKTSKAGDYYITFNKGKASGYSAAHGTTSFQAVPTDNHLDGNITLLLNGEFKGANSMFGIANAGSVTGNVTLIFDSETASYANLSTNTPATVAGAHKGNIGGTFKAVINSGTFEKHIYGGVHTGDANTIGRTQIYVNGGSIGGSVFGGGRTGSIGVRTRSTEPATLVTVTNGEIAENVYGGGAGGTINGDTKVVLTGGTVMGNVYGGGTGGTINGSTSVTIDGNLVAIHGNTISGGGTGGTITGDSAVIIKNAATSDYDGTIDKFTGTISGGEKSVVKGTRTLSFDTATLRGTAFDTATISNFDAITLRNSEITLSSLGGATELALTSSVLKVTGDASTLQSITMDIASSLALASIEGDIDNPFYITLQGNNVDVSKLSVTLTGVTYGDGVTLDNVYILANGITYTAEIAWLDQQGTARNLVVGTIIIPEPTTATLSLLALAALAARRRRK